MKHDQARNMLTTRTCLSVYFSLQHPALTDIYTLSLHDALPICSGTSLPVTLKRSGAMPASLSTSCARVRSSVSSGDRKSTRLNSSHVEISYGVFCLKKKKIYKNKCRN